MRSLEIGARAELTRRFTAEDLAEYRALTGDVSAVEHVPGMLLGGMISRLLGVELPGRGTNWMKQALRFHSAARVGEPITASVEIVRLRPDKDLVNLHTRCVDAAGALICDGEALVMAREMV